MNWCPCLVVILHNYCCQLFNTIDARMRRSFATSVFTVFSREKRFWSLVLNWYFRNCSMSKNLVYSSSFQPKNIFKFLSNFVHQCGNKGLSKGSFLFGCIWYFWIINLKFICFFMHLLSSFNLHKNLLTVQLIFVYILKTIL